MKSAVRAKSADRNFSLPILPFAAHPGICCHACTFNDPCANQTSEFFTLLHLKAKGLYQPDSIASYEAGGLTYLVMANEGDTRDDDADKERAKDLFSGLPDDLKRLNVSVPDSTANELYAFGARSFSIRDANGNLVFDSGNELEAHAIALGIYNDKRSDDKGGEPEGIELFEMNGFVLAFVGLERTTKSAVAVYDVTDPVNSKYLTMIVGEDDVSPEGLEAFRMNGVNYLAVANEVSKTTSLFRFNVVPEPGSIALSMLGLGLLASMRLRRKRV